VIGPALRQYGTVHLRIGEAAHIAMLSSLEHERAELALMGTIRP
jgi:hypothetical protein